MYSHPSKTTPAWAQLHSSREWLRVIRCRWKSSTMTQSSATKLYWKVLTEKAKYLTKFLASPKHALLDPHKSVKPSPDRFIRLNRSHTLSSIRHERSYRKGISSLSVWIYHNLYENPLLRDPRVPSDSLDFTIKAQYNPWQFGATKAETKTQVTLDFTKPY